MKKVRWAWCVAAGVSVSSLACADLLGVGDVPTPLDALASDDAADELPPFDAAGCDACAVVPAGWTPVLVSMDASCPAGWTTSTALETSPMIEAGACTCIAQNLVAPSCTNGSASFYVDCTNQVTVAVADGGCSSFPPQTLTNDEQVAPLAPTGGSCTASPVTDPGKLSTSAVTTCTSACPAEACAGEAPPGFSGCIEQLGADASCPAPFTNRHVFATSYTLDCACGGCTAATTCVQGALTLYDDCASKGFVLALDANDQCYMNLQRAGATVAGAVYSAYSNPPTYTPDPPVASAIAKNERTVCCR